MPPKPKYSKEEIVKAAYEIADELGRDAVVAREVGRKLGTSTAPIFTYFSSMEELDNEVIALAKSEMFSYLLECTKYKPVFKEFGMRWVKFAMEHPYLYSMIIDTDINMDTFEPLVNPLVKEIEVTFNLNEEHSFELLNQAIIHANGIIAFSENNNFTEEMISKSLSETTLGLVFSFQMLEGTFDVKMASEMVKVKTQIPKENKNVRN